MHDPAPSLFFDLRGSDMLIACPAEVGMSASHYDASDQEGARNIADLVPGDEISMRMAHLHRGLGSSACGPESQPGFRLEAAGTHAFTIRLRPFHGDNWDHASLARRWPAGSRMLRS